MTQELPKETATRGRRMAALTAKSSTRANKDGASSDRKRKTLNLATYKYHALSDYPETIRRFGTTDNYNTQIVCILSPCDIWANWNYYRARWNTDE